MSCRSGNLWTNWKVQKMQICHEESNKLAHRSRMERCWIRPNYDDREVFWNFSNCRKVSFVRFVNAANWLPQYGSCCYFVYGVRLQFSVRGFGSLWSPQRGRGLRCVRWRSPRMTERELIVSGHKRRFRVRSSSAHRTGALCAAKRTVCTHSLWTWMEEQIKLVE